jgi:hypothetical protein
MIEVLANCPVAERGIPQVDGCRAGRSQQLG